MQAVPQPIGAGAEFLGLNDDRFKTTRLTVALLLPLREETASSNAILPFLLRRSCAEYPRFAELQRHLNELYGARIIPEVTRIGNNQALILTAVSIDDRFALQKEDISLQCAKLLRSMLFLPVLGDGAFPSSDTEQEKRCLVELIESEINEKRLYARHRCEQILCEGEGYAVNRYGNIDGVNSLTPGSVAAAWRNMLKSARIRIIYQGAGSGDAVLDAFREGLELIGRNPVSFDTDAGWDASRGVKEITERMDVNQSKLVMGFRAPGNAGIPQMRLMNALLGGTPHSLLFKNAREKLGLCYYCSSSYDRLGGVLLVDSGVDGQNAGKAREEILRQLDSVCRGEFTGDEMESARRSLTNQFQTLGDLQSSLAGWYVGQSLDKIMTAPEQAAEELAAVTRENIMEAARRVKPGAVYLLTGKEGGHVG